MAEFTDALTEKHIACIAKQPVFFTATAAADGRINLSPKGYADSFRILSDTQVAYLDLGGSGNEKHAHLAADGRITVMFCAFARGELRSEERRVGRECVRRGSYTEVPDQKKQKNIIDKGQINTDDNNNR